MTEYQKQSGKLFREVFVAGTLGAFFVAIAQTSCADIEAWFMPHVIEFPYAAMRPLCYGYVFWFLIYFYYSTLWTKLDERPLTVWDRLFYLVQAAGSAVAIFWLGFFADKHGRSDSPISFVIANLAITAICLTAWILSKQLDVSDKSLNVEGNDFSATSMHDLKPELNHLRLTGMAVGLLGIGGILLLNPGRDATAASYQPLVLLIAVLQGAHWYVLAEFRLFTIGWSSWKSAHR